MTDMTNPLSLEPKGGYTPGPLNYDPADPEKMKLPAGASCGDCVHIRRCTLIFGHTSTDTICDWAPSRFKSIARATGD